MVRKPSKRRNETAAGVEKRSRDSAGAEGDPSPPSPSPFFDPTGEEERSSRVGYGSLHLLEFGG